MITQDPQGTDSRNRRSAERRLNEWLDKKGFSQKELAELLGLMSDVCVVNAAPDPEYPVVAETELQHDRRREREMFEATGEDPFSAVEVQRILDAAEVEELLADLPREERTMLYMSASHDQAEIAVAMGCSVPTVQRRLRSARRRIHERHGILARIHGGETVKVETGCELPPLGLQSGEVA